jgi:hypothetical protein
MASSIPVFGTRFLNDMDFYTLFADKLLSGRVLYRDAMDTKPPLVFVHYALVFKLFGLNNLSAVKLVTLGWLPQVMACRPTATSTWPRLARNTRRSRSCSSSRRSPSYATTRRSTLRRGTTLAPSPSLLGPGDSLLMRRNAR